MKERGCRLQRLGTDFTISLPRHLNRSLKMQPSVSPIKWYNLSERETEISGLLKAAEKRAHDDERSFTFSRWRRTDDDVKKAELGKKKGEIDKATSKKKREEGERG